MTPVRLEPATLPSRVKHSTTERERMNGVLKHMLKKICQKKPKDWDRYLSAFQFAYGDVPFASTGFSPFKLMYGKTFVDQVF